MLNAESLKIDKTIENMITSMIAEKRFIFMGQSEHLVLNLAVKSPKAVKV
jgi:hypothetical protein